jgi:ribonuclease R
MKEKITALLKEKKAMSPKEIAQALKITSSAQTRELAIALNELEDEKAIFNDHSQYVLVDGIRYMSGRARDVSMNEYAVFNKDQKVYVPKRDSRFLMDKDEVLVKLDRRGNEVVHVYERGITYIPGTFTPTRRGLKFRSDVDLHTSFIVQNQRDFDPKAGDKAVVKVTEYSSPLKVKIEKVLGNEKDPGVDIECILTENEVRQEFGKKSKKGCCQYSFQSPQKRNQGQKRSAQSADRHH